MCRFPNALVQEIEFLNNFGIFNFSTTIYGCDDGNHYVGTSYANLSSVKGSSTATGLLTNDAVIINYYEKLEICARI